MSRKIEIQSASPSEDRKNSWCKNVIKYMEPISYETFFVHHLQRNVPCIFGDWVTENWPARKYWVNKDATPNIHYMRNHFGGSIVPVANCKEKYFDSHKREEMSLEEYFQCWKKEEGCLYLKDWHFMKDFPSYEAFDTPCYFASDWLNEYWLEAKSDDYRFVYLGPSGSWTPFHCDVFGSYSWSANMCGRKRWLLFPPGEEEKLKDRFGSVAYDILSPDLRDESMFPGGKTAQPPIEVVQEAGECIFIPSGWYHQVHNMEDTISINHNWINGTNIDLIWQKLMAALAQVEESINDCTLMDDWSPTCQSILKVHFGMSINDLAEFLRVIAERRLNVSKGCHTESFNGWMPGNQHIAYDINKLTETLKRILNETSPEVLSCIDDSANPSTILNKLGCLL